MSIAGDDLYNGALERLRKRVDTRISQEEYDSIRLSSCSIDEALLATDKQYVAKRNPAFRNFMHSVRILLEPLIRFKSALDTMCQVVEPASLLWGSIKVILVVTGDMNENHEIIAESLKHLTDILPVHEEYRSILSSQANCPLRAPLTRIYVEILTFCILTTRYARRSLLKTVGEIVTSPTDQKDLKLCLKTIEKQSQLVSNITIARTYNSVEELRTIVMSLSSRTSSSHKGHRRPLNNLPGLLSSKFVRRENEIEWINSMLESSDPKYSRKRVAVYGLTGVGKTQLVLKYDDVHGHKYSSKFFLVAGSQDKLLDSVQKTLDLLDVPERTKPELHLKLGALRSWLEQEQSWLLIFDNVGEIEYKTILEIIPLKSNGHVILTSQRPNTLEKITGSLRLCMELEMLNIQDAIELFFEASEVEKNTESQLLATDIVKLVGMLPHAIDQCGSYVKENAVDLRNYLDRYRKEPAKVLSLRGVYSGHRVEISTHFSIALQTLETDYPASANLLRLLSLFEPEAIPTFQTWMPREGTCELRRVHPPTVKSSKGGLLTWLYCCGGDTEEEVEESYTVQEKYHSAQDTTASAPYLSIQRIVEDTPELERAIAKLWGLSLIRRDRERRSLWMHDLTRLFVNQTIPAPDIQYWLLSAMEIIYHTFPQRDNTIVERSFVDVYLPQAASLVAQARDAGIKVHRYARLLSMCAHGYHNRGSYARALKWYRAAQSEYDLYLGPEYFQTVRLLNRIAWVYYDLGDLAMCESYHRHVLKIREDSLGSNELATLESVNNLAAAIERQGKMIEAEALFTRLYKQYNKDLGPQHPCTLAGAHNLANCYANQGKLASAVQLYEVTLKLSEEGLGKESPGTLDTLANFAVAVDHRARLNEAEMLYDRALLSYSKVYGTSHLQTLQIRTNVAGLYRRQCRLKTALMTVRAILVDYLQVLEPKHWQVTAAYYDMAEILHEKGVLREAKECYELSLGSHSIAGEDYPVQLRTVDAMCVLERESGHLEGVETLALRAYEANKRVLSWESPYTLTSANNYAELQHAQGLLEKANDLYGKTRAGFKDLVGEQHPYCLMVVNNLGRLAWQTKSADPITHFATVFEGYKAVLGEAHASTLTVKLNIARTKLARGQLEEAKSLIEQVSESWREVDNGIHPFRSVSEYFLGIVYAASSQLQTARGHLQAAIEGYARNIGIEHPNCLLAHAMLLRILRQLGEDTEAESLISVIESQLQSSGIDSPIASLGMVSLKTLIDADPESFDWGMHISLPWGETTRMRWNCKTWWREAKELKTDDCV